MSRTSPFKTFTPRRVNGRESDHVTRLLLRRRARQIESREHFERIVAQAQHPDRVRQLLEPLLRPNLPCCLPTATDEPHTEGCPTRKEEPACSIT